MQQLQFDLLSAMMRMKKEFGNASEIMAGNTDIGFFLRLMIYHQKQQYVYQFEITHADIANANNLLFGDHFDMAIAKLKSQIA